MDRTGLISVQEIITLSNNQLQERFCTSQKDTGSPEVQIALLQRRISILTEHLKENRKDHSSYRGLRCLLGQQTRLMRYLKRVSAERYQSLLSRITLNVKKV